MQKYHSQRAPVICVLGNLFRIADYARGMTGRLSRSLTKRQLAVVAGTLFLTPAAYASPPLPSSDIATIRQALGQCTGGAYRVGGGRRGPEALLPSVDALSRPSAALDKETGTALYTIARALFPEQAALPEFIGDPTSALICPARPAQSVAMLRYLMGEGPDDWRGQTNAFDWLGLAAERGIGMAPDPALARRTYLRGRIHSAVLPNDRWSDGIDDDLLANIERAGLRPYLEELASFDRHARSGGAARMILAEAALPHDPAAARAWLRTPYIPALSRLIELEAEGALPTASDREDIAFWASLIRRSVGWRRWLARTTKGARLHNGGTIPTAAERPGAKRLRPVLDLSALKDGAQAGTQPVPIRALVDPEGRALFVEDCRATPLARGTIVANMGFRMQALRLYDPDRLPKLPVSHVDGRAAYGWVILPAALFRRVDDGKVAVSLVDLPADQCRFSNVDPYDTPPPPAPAPRR